MAARGAAQVLRERIGNDATDALITMMDESSRSMEEHIIKAVGDRVERRLTEEISRLDRRLIEEVPKIDRRLTEEVSGVRVEMHKGFGELRAQIADGKEGVIRWAFLFWVSQLAAMVGLLSYLK